MNIEKHVSFPREGKRLIYDLTDFGIPGIPYLAAQNLPQTSPGLPMHTHRERIEINHFLKGERVYRVGDRDYHLKGNEIFITWPDEVHGSGSFLHGRGVHFWIQMALPRPGAPFLGYTGETANALLTSIWNIPRRQFHAEAPMQSLYSQMLYLCKKGPSPLARIEMITLVTKWLLTLVHSANAPWKNEITPDINKALEVIRQNPATPHSVGKLADIACLSESHFKIKFKQQLGLPPGDYLLRRRIEKGAEMLLQGRRNITEIAYELGFSSSQHFSTMFKKFFGTSPRGWTKLCEKDASVDPAPHGASEERPWIEDGVFHGYLRE